MSLSSEISSPGGFSARLLRLAPAAVAAYELRYLITHLLRLVSGAATIQISGGTGALCLVAAVAASGLLLRESVRGLPTRLMTRGRSSGLLRDWLSCTAGLGLLLVAVLTLTTATAGGHTGTVAHAIGLGDWSAAGPALLLAGLLLALSLRGARWLIARVRPMLALSRVSRTDVALGFPRSSSRGAGAPLRAGWSDRGPPTGSPVF